MQNNFKVKFKVQNKKDDPRLVDITESNKLPIISDSQYTACFVKKGTGHKNYICFKQIRSQQV